MTIPRELHLPSPAPGVAQRQQVDYLEPAPSLVRRELLGQMSKSDSQTHWLERISTDNGRSWSSATPLEGVVRETPEGGIVHYPPAIHHHPHTARTYRFSMMRQWPGLPCFTYTHRNKHAHPLVDHTFVTEGDAAPVLLRYEQGADYNPDQPFDPAYTDHNIAYRGVGVDFGPDGSVWHPVVCNRPGQAIGQAGLVLFRLDPKAECCAHPTASRSTLMSPGAACWSLTWPGCKTVG